MRSARLTLILASAVLLVRCTSFEATPPAPSPDADTPASEAGADADVPGIDGGCGHLFCEDFDDGDAWTKRWEATAAGGNSGQPAPTIGVDTTSFATPPSSFFAVASSFGYGAVAQIEMVFDARDFATGIRCSLDVQVLGQPDDGLSSFVAIAVQGAGPSYAAHLGLEKGGATRMYDPDASGSKEVSGPLLGDTWKKLTVELRPGAASAFIVTAGDRYELPLQGLPANIERYALRLGVVFGNPYTSNDVRMHVRFDAVRCDPAP